MILLTLVDQPSKPSQAVSAPWWDGWVMITTMIWRRMEGHVTRTGTTLLDQGGTTLESVSPPASAPTVINSLWSPPELTCSETRLLCQWATTVESVSPLASGPHSVHRLMIPSRTEQWSIAYDHIQNEPVVRQDCFVREPLQYSMYPYQQLGPRVITGL